MFLGKKLDKNNPRKTWQTIKSHLPNNKEALLTINKIVVDVNEICEITTIVDHSNNCFANVGNMLAQTYAD